MGKEDKPFYTRDYIHAFALYQKSENENPYYMELFERGELDSIASVMSMIEKVGNNPECQALVAQLNNETFGKN